jgi:hypothetical protein
MTIAVKDIFYLIINKTKGQLYKCLPFTWHA